MDNPNIGYEIRYTDTDQFGNVDLPDISVVDNLDVSAPVTFAEFAPFNSDGTVNSDSIRFNINPRSRTFNNTGAKFPYGSEFYNSLNAGAFDEATGYDEVGGVGGVPTGGGGIPELSEDGQLTEPFDAFSLRVFFDKPASNLHVIVSPGDDVESVLIYGQNEPVSQDLVLLDGDHVVNFQVGAHDFGDAPPASETGFPHSYPVTRSQDGARHAIGTLILGTVIDSELDGQPLGVHGPAASDGDDSLGTPDDEDGVTPIASIVSVADSETTSSFHVTSSQVGKLDAWIDFNRDGAWAASEKISDSVEVVAGSNVMPFTVPPGAAVSDTCARFRLSSHGNLGPTGRAADGEVEDHMVKLLDGGIRPDVEINVDGDVSIRNDYGVRVSEGLRSLFAAPIEHVGTVNLLGNANDNNISLDFNTPYSERLHLDGGEGLNSLFISTGSVDFTKAGNISAERFKFIQTNLASSNTITIDANTVAGLDPIDQLIWVALDGDSDEIDFVDAKDWRMAEPFMVGVFARQARNQVSGEQVLVYGPHHWQNVIDASDIDNSGHVSAVDALTIINELGRRTYSDPSTKKLHDPLDIGAFPGIYYDQNGDGKSTALDALRVINRLAIIYNTFDGEAVFVFPESSPRIVVYHQVSNVGLLTSSKDLPRDAENQELAVADNTPEQWQSAIQLIKMSREAIHWAEDLDQMLAEKTALDELLESFDRTVALLQEIGPSWDANLG